jgi:DnaJ-class molecular chaperone
MNRPNRCTECDGIGLKVGTAPSKLYRCGVVTFAYTCPTCLGSGRSMPVSIADSKLAAAGDSL